MPRISRGTRCRWCLIHTRRFSLAATIRHLSLPLWSFAVIVVLPAAATAQDAGQARSRLDDPIHSGIHSRAGFSVRDRHALTERRDVLGSEGVGGPWRETRVTRGPSILKWAAIGLGVGAVAGSAAFVAGRCSRFKDPLGSGCTSKRTAVVVGGTLGGAVGALIGAVAAWSQHGPADITVAGRGAR